MRQFESNNASGGASVRGDQRSAFSNQYSVISLQPFDKLRTSPSAFSLFFKGIFGLTVALMLLGLVSSNTVSAQPLACTEIYTVQANDWLSKVADKFLGSTDFYPAIIAATNEQHQADPSFPQISDPNTIEAGWKLCIPSADAAADAPPAPAVPAYTDDALVNALIADLMEPPDDTPVITPREYTIDDFVNEHTFPEGIRAEWFYSTPEPITRYEITPEMQAVDDAYGYRANYLWNDNLGERYFRVSGIFDATPPQVKLFEGPDDTVLPRFRYPPNITLPTGLTTNKYGWRGTDIDMQKPANTIRIAAVGASTTVGGHGLPHSYPEFLEHWLNLWSQENGYDVNFEVINAGREGLNSNDIMYVVRHEILPMDVDYVIYYEGANQFHPETMVHFPPEYTLGKPPPGIVPNLNNVESDDKTLLDKLSEYSAIAARARNIVEQFLVTGEEPPKPEQTFHLPDGQDEFNPDLQIVGGALELDRILRHLGNIKADLDANDAKMIMSTFEWFVYDDMVLDSTRNRNLYSYINRVYWPISYDNIRRAADFQNRVFVKWAAQNGVPIVDVAGQIPKEPDLFDDAIHTSHLGTRVRAWLNFETLVPLLKQDIESGTLPRSAKATYTEHPFLTDDYVIKELPAE